MDEKNKIVKGEALNNSEPKIEVSLEDLNRQLEFYTNTLVQIEKLNQQYINKINKLQNENNYYKALLNTKVYIFASYLRNFIDKIKTIFKS
ncbi:hypothetical protein BGI41_00450 [Methanobrevibacter sp. 87.7]|uniref:hypothetical protein n=1 Tax=Methanobrevibacter sp. 87.7 TaxID=387957 RepID=UPI000B505066|nr:hypothetical protein [Methanobrevibacter sp. 87.7]OWT33820.1 hypothetical protein BGI41_00450 [Methanobrevibacter sp. 87.7]